MNSEAEGLAEPVKPPGAGQPGDATRPSGVKPPDEVFGPARTSSPGSASDADGASCVPAAAVIFDNDGVLVDSSASVRRAWSRWGSERGLDVAEVVAAAHTRPSRDTVAAFVAEADRADALAAIDRLEIDDVGAVTAVPGAVALLRAIPAGRWAVVTSGNRALASARLAVAGLPHPDVLVTADDVRSGKPDPEGYALAIRLLGVAPEATVVLEDSRGGIAAALAAGVGTVIGVGEGTRGSGVAHVVEDLRAVRWTDGGLLVRPAEPSADLPTDPATDPPADGGLLVRPADPSADPPADRLTDFSATDRPTDGPA